MAALRGLHLAAMLSLLGVTGFIAWMLPAAGDTPSAPERLNQRLHRVWWVSGLIALLAGMAWFVLQASAIAGADTLPGAIQALPLVALHTRYGNVLMVRLGLLLLATLLAFPRRRLNGAAASLLSGAALYLTLLLTAIALGLQSMIGHAGAVAGDTLLVSETLHLLAGGLWLGALLPLWLSLRALTPAQAALVCVRFSPIGLGCVLVLAGTGLAQGLQLIGSLPALLGTPYGQIALLKIGLFVLALVLATLNRLWLSDRLAAAASGARTHLLLSVGLEICLGMAIVAAAAFMASSVPASHTTPVWPFSWQFSLVTMREDPDLLREVVLSLVMIGAAIVLLIAALTGRRFRLAALGVLALAVVTRGPSLELLTVQAYPTSFQTSPTGFSAASIAHGRQLFGPNCASCHGANGEGDGPAAAGMHIKPANLVMPHIWGHTDGEMFWWLSHGIEDPEGGLAMPGFRLPPDDLWALIDYVRAHAAGSAMQQEGAFDVPLPAPELPVACNGLAATTMAELHGHFVRVIAGDVGSAEVVSGAMVQDHGSHQTDVSVVTLALRMAGTPAPGACTALNPAGWQAYAVLADLPSATLTGTEFLIDPAGWLRAIHRPGTPGGWDTQASLAAAIRVLQATPIQQPDGGQHDHHH